MRPRRWSLMVGPLLRHEWLGDTLVHAEATDCFGAAWGPGSEGHRWDADRDGFAWATPSNGPGR